MSTSRDRRTSAPDGDSSEGAPGHRKAYRSPKLVIYGDVRAITQNVGSRSMPDGGAKPSWKSRL